MTKKAAPADRVLKMPELLVLYAYWMSCQVTALPLYGGILLPLEIGAVVVGVPTTFQTPLSGHFSPVRALVPIGARVLVE